MKDIRKYKPSKLGYYHVRLSKGSALHEIYGKRKITARYVERDRKCGGTHRFFDLPKPSTGVEAWKFVSER